MTPARTSYDRAPALAFLEWLRVLDEARHDLIAHGRLHGQLVRIEWELQKRRLLRVLLLALIGLATLICTMMCTAVLVLGMTWDTTYRVPAMLLMPLAFAGATWVLWRSLRSVLHEGAGTFSASLEELAADAALLRSSK